MEASKAKRSLRGGEQGYKERRDCKESRKNSKLRMRHENERHGTRPKQVSKHFSMVGFVVFASRGIIVGRQAAHHGAKILVTFGIHV